MVWLPVSLNSLIWLMLVVYAIHIYEESIMYLPWRHKNNQPLEYKSGLLKTMTDQGAA